MFLAPRRLALTVCAFAAPMALAAANPASASAPGSYLAWQNKTPQGPAPAVTTNGETYAVPPSPYGQVGDPFARSLSWSGKAATAKPAPQPKPQALANIDVPPPPAAEMPKGPVSMSSPVPVPRPAPVRVPDQAVAAPPKAEAPKPQPMQAPQPKPAPAAPQQASTTGGYQVPATSKYAARIAAARNAQAQEQAQEQAPQQQAATAPAKPGKGAKQPAQATAPAPAPSLASQETDHVFIPGEQYKNPEDGPRLYSLHRAYGLTPDPITVDRDATGAILETADLNADEGDKDSAQDSAKDTDSKPSDTKAKP